MSPIETIKEIDVLIADKKRDKEYIRHLNGSRNKVRYLRAKLYRQEEVAEMIGITPRHVQRIEKELREECLL